MANVSNGLRIGLLSSGEGWHVRDLQRAAMRLGHETTVIDFRSLSSTVAGHDPLDAVDAVVVRTMPPGSLEQVIFRMDVLHRLHRRGVRVVNAPRALETCIDKYLADVLLHEAGLPIVATRVCQDADRALAAFEQLGSDVVVKPLFGSEGRGMMRISDVDLAWRTFHTLERIQSVIYMQKYVVHPGWDLRVFVLAGRVIHGMRRQSRCGWRTKVAQGGRADPARVTESEEELALRAAKAVGADVAGIDLLPAADGSLFVLEVNAVPGWRALARVTKADIASEILRYVSS